MSLEKLGFQIPSWSSLAFPAILSKQAAGIHESKGFSEGICCSDLLSCCFRICRKARLIKVLVSAIWAFAVQSEQNMNASSPPLHLQQGGQMDHTGWNTNNSTVPPFVFYRLNASLTIIIAVLVMAFFFMGMVALYVWRCSSEDDIEAALQAAGVLRRPPIKRVQGIDKAGMEQLPVFCYQGSKEQAECAVCLANFEDGDKIRLLPKCSHSFHTKCIDVWLSAHASCPICRCNLINSSSSASSSQQSQAQQQIISSSQPELISSSQPEVHVLIENLTTTSI